MRLLLLAFLATFFHFFLNSQEKVSFQSALDSAIIYRAKANDSKQPLERSLMYALKSVQFAKLSNRDSTILNSNRVLSLQYLYNDLDSLYREVNRFNLKLGQELNDSSAVASANHNLGTYYYKNYVNDSAFYYYSRALKLHDLLNNNQNKADILMAIANMQETEKDYVESEKNAVEAIKLYNKLPRTDNNLENLWILNNLIGIISLKLHHYDKSLEYHNKALKISKRQDDYGVYNYLFSLNNQAFTYRKKGNLKKAISIYNELLERRQEYEDYDPTFYPLVLNNLAYTKLIDENPKISEIELQFLEAVQISDRLQDETTMLDVSIDICKFYLHQKQRDSALYYAEKSYDLATRISNNDLLLESMRILADLKGGEEGMMYLKRHILLTDSLQQVERSFRDKYARVEYETDQLEEENRLYAQQKIWLAATSAALLIALGLVYIIITQRAKNKELQFVQDQQKANEEIYNLMLSQQEKVDEARANEKKRISQEIHDGVLGRLFGTRLSLDSLNFSEGNEAVQNRMQYIAELKTIEEDIRKISHDLNTDFVAGSGFKDILDELIEKQTKAYQLAYDFDCTDDVNWELVPNKTKINIYRVIQESMQNIYKHAEAKHIKISIALKNNVICLGISDDGVGFDVNKSRKGIGLKNINSRIDDLEGSVTFQSEIDQGTTVDIRIPYLS